MPTCAVCSVEIVEDSSGDTCSSECEKKLDESGAKKVKYQFKDTTRVFWYIGYSHNSYRHIINLLCGDELEMNIEISVKKIEKEENPLSIHEIMMTIAQRFSSIGLSFASGLPNVKEVSQFDFE
jgi:predicted nucleic acid-binding Zn ribbon protein